MLKSLAAERSVWPVDGDVTNPSGLLKSELIPAIRRLRKRANSF